MSHLGEVLQGELLDLFRHGLQVLEAELVCHSSDALAKRFPQAVLLLPERRGGGIVAVQTLDPDRQILGSFARLEGPQHLKNTECTG